MRNGNRFAFAWLLLIAGCASPKSSVPTETPPELAQLLREGQEAERRGDAASAQRAYEVAHLAYGDHSAPCALLGEFRRFWQHDGKGASHYFQLAIDASKPDDHWIAFAWRGLGEVARWRGEIDRAIQVFEKSLSIKPNADAHRSLSALYATEKRDFEKAAHHAKAAVDLSPEDPIALVQYAVQMARFKKFEESEEAFWKAMGIAGCDERGRSNGLVHCCVLYNGACYHAVRGNKADALAMLKEFFSTPNHRHITREEIVRDPDFESLVKDPDFKALLDYRLPEE